jgi:hypothetical protein
MSPLGAVVFWTGTNWALPGGVTVVTAGGLNCMVVRPVGFGEIKRVSNKKISASIMNDWVYIMRAGLRSIKLPIMIVFYHINYI